MARAVNPRGIAPPVSNYSHGIVHSARARRLVISGQVALGLDGVVPDPLRDQIDLAFDNLIAVVVGAGMAVPDIVKVTVYCTVQGSAALVRQCRDRKFGGHRPAATYLEVAGLADPRWRVEIEGEAVCEEPDILFEELPGAMPETLGASGPVTRGRGQE